MTLKQEFSTLMEYMSLSDWAKENGIPLLVGGLGVVMMGVGIWQSQALRMKQDGRVEITAPASPSPNADLALIVVDVGGAVEKPGVYQLNEGSRVNDALMKAGGLGSNADRAYVSRSINLADKLRDGAKIYIPTKDDPTIQQVINEQVLGVKETQTQTIDINTATISELDRLWGVGQARAQQIVENRPYNTIEELVTRARMPQSVLDHNAGIIQL